MKSHYIRARDTGASPWEVDVTPESAGWEFSGLRVRAMSVGEVLEYAEPENETIALPLNGGFDIEVEKSIHRLVGRENVFSGPSDALYIPLGSSARITSTGNGRIALLRSKAEKRLPVQYLAAGDTPIGRRGHGRTSRHAHEFCVTQGLQSDRLVAMEVYTPAGNWSSYPPHKHDAENGTESQLEEVYYFEIEPVDAKYERGFFRAYSADERPLDIVEEVHNGDVALIPYGWHGPAIAPPHSRLYYLNVMAGSGSSSRWEFSDDPDYSWVRRLWAPASTIAPVHQR